MEENNNQNKLGWQGIFVLILLGFIALIWILSSGNNAPSAPSVTQNNNSQPRAQNDLFAKKAECATYTQKLRDNLEMDQFVIESLYQVFYSSIKNTCLSAKYVLYSAHGTVQEGEVLRIDDILTGENIWKQGYEPSMKYFEAEAILDQQISALK